MCPSLKNLRFPPECQENFSTHISQRRNIKTSRTRWKTNAVCIRVGGEEEGGGRINSFIFSFRMTSVSWMLEMCKWVPINNIILLLSLYPCKHVSLRLALYLTPTFVSSWPFVPYQLCSRAPQFTYLLRLNCCSCSVLWNWRFRRNTHTHMHTLTHAVGVDICIMGICSLRTCMHARRYGVAKMPEWHVSLRKRALLRKMTHTEGIVCMFATL